MKKGIILALALMLALSLGCGGDEEAVVIDPNADRETSPAQTETAPETASETSQGESYVFTAEGMEILPNTAAEPVLNALGAAAHTYEADSCAYQGKDYYYQFKGFELTVNDVDGVRTITSIAVVDDTISVPFQNGSLKIGDTADALRAVLGGEAGQEQYDFHSPLVHLQISLRDGRIGTMVFMAPEEY